MGLRIPTLFQGRGILDDVLLQVRLDTLRDDFNNGRFTLQKRGKVKFTGPLYELRVEDGALDEYGNEMPACRVGFERARVLAHNMIIHPMSSLPVGLLLRYSPENEPVRVRVPLRFINQEKSSGLRVGGWLNRIHSAVDINVAAGIKAPLFVTADVGNMKMKDKFPIGQLMFDGKGQGCKTVLNDDVTCIIMSKA